MRRIRRTLEGLAPYVGDPAGNTDQKPPPPPRFFRLLFAHYRSLLKQNPLSFEELPFPESEFLNPFCSVRAPRPMALTFCPLAQSDSPLHRVFESTAWLASLYHFPEHVFRSRLFSGPHIVPASRLIHQNYCIVQEALLLYEYSCFLTIVVVITKVLSVL